MLKYHLHTLINTYTFINFWEICHLHNNMVLHDYLAGYRVSMYIWKEICMYICAILIVVFLSANILTSCISKKSKIVPIFKKHFSLQWRQSCKYSQSLKKIPTILSIYSLFACFHRGRASPRRATHTQKSLFLLWLQAIQKFATRPNKVTGFTNVMGTLWPISYMRPYKKNSEYN